MKLKVLAKTIWPKELMTKLWNDDRGQSTTEYILILAAVVMIALKFKTTFGERLDKIITKLDTKIGSALDEQ